jgi:hypothetical protein
MRTRAALEPPRTPSRPLTASGAAGRALGAVAVASALVVLGASPAASVWSSHGTGSPGSATAASVIRPAAPSVAKSGSTAVVTWTAVTLTGGKAVGGYTVKRHVGATTTTVCTSTAPTVTCSDTAPVSGTVTYGVVATVQAWSSQESPTTSFVYDVTAPTTTASATGTPNANGWISAASSTVTVSATDTESGVASVSYRLNSGTWTTVGGSSTNFSVATQGTTTVSYYATDNAGNIATTKTLTVKLDNVAPTVSVTYPPSGTIVSATWNGNCRNSSNAVSNGLCGTSADATSGVTTVEYLLSRTPAAGGTTVCWNGSSWSAGNCSTYRTTAQGPSGITSWYVALAASNLGTGNFDLRIRVTDAAGNASPVTSATRTFSVGV